MLATREVVQESTVFSPNDLVFGHKVCGLLAVLQNSIKIADCPKNLESYVYGFKQRLVQARELAKIKLEKQQKVMKCLYDRTVEPRVFEPGDQVLVLRPLVCSPFEAKFDGPYVVQCKVSALNYVIATPGWKKSTKLCHINLLKPFYESQNEMNAVSSKSVQPALPVVSVLHGSSNLMGGEKEDIEPGDCILGGRLNNSESLQRLDSILSHLPPLQRAELISVLTSFPDLFGDTPSRTDWIEHDINVGEAKPIKQHFYRVSPDKREIMEAEITTPNQKKLGQYGKRK